MRRTRRLRPVSGSSATVSKVQMFWSTSCTIVEPLAGPVDLVKIDIEDSDGFRLKDRLHQRRPAWVPGLWLRIQPWLSRG